LIKVLSLFAGVELLAEVLGLQTAIDEVRLARRTTAVLHIIAASIPAMLLPLTTAADLGSHTPTVLATGSGE